MLHQGIIRWKKLELTHIREDLRLFEYLVQGLVLEEKRENGREEGKMEGI